MGLLVHMDRPLLGIVSRLADQKGFELLAESLNVLIENEVTVAVLGSGDKKLEDMFRRFAAEHPDQFGVRIGYDTALAHRIEAGADMFLMPSLRRTPGLNQIYSLRYGTVPIVRATGGLDDTVDSSTGFKFGVYSPRALAGAIREALHAWQFRDAWKERMRRGMGRDFSWEASAAEYQRLYAEVASP